MPLEVIHQRQGGPSLPFTEAQEARPELASLLVPAWAHVLQQGALTLTLIPPRAPELCHPLLAAQS